jgi:hypothetical protein
MLHHPHIRSCITHTFFIASPTHSLLHHPLATMAAHSLYCIAHLLHHDCSRYCITRPPVHSIALPTHCTHDRPPYRITFRCTHPPYPQSLPYCITHLPHPHPPAILHYPFATPTRCTHAHLPYCINLSPCPPSAPMTTCHIALPFCHAHLPHPCPPASLHYPPTTPMTTRLIALPSCSILET